MYMMTSNLVELHHCDLPQQLFTVEKFFISYFSSQLRQLKCVVGRTYLATHHKFTVIITIGKVTLNECINIIQL